MFFFLLQAVVPFVGAGAEEVVLLVGRGAFSSPAPDHRIVVMPTSKL